MIRRVLIGFAIFLTVIISAHAQNTLPTHQATDAGGKGIATSNIASLITTNTTTTIFTGEGTLNGVQCWLQDGTATFYFTDADDTAITGLPASGSAVTVDTKGFYTIPRMELSNGLKVVTASGTAFSITVFAFQ